MSRIALLHYSSPPIVGGVESVLAQHARMMTEAGHQVTIFTGRGKVFDERIQVCLLPHLDSRNRDVLRVKSQLDAGNYTGDFDALRDRIRDELSLALPGYDLLFAHNVASLHKNLPLTAAIHEMYELPGFPGLILWHHDLAWNAPRYRKELHEGYPWDLLRSDWSGVTQVVVSATRRQQLSELLNIPKESIRIIPNGVEICRFFKLEQKTIQLVNQLKLDEANPLLLLPARLTRRKNIELALHVLAELLNDFPAARLLVTGPEGPHNPTNVAYKQKLIGLRNQLNLRGKALFLAEVSPDFLPDAVIADFYRLADALIFPSREEGFGIPILEAGFSSIPVFCTDIPVLRELGGDDVSYFNTRADPSSIARQITMRLNHEATSRWARRVKREYAWDSIYKSLIEPLIQEVSG